MISHLFNRCSMQNVALVENQEQVRCYLMACMMILFLQNDMFCSFTYPIGSVSHICKYILGRSTDVFKIRESADQESIQSITTPDPKYYKCRERISLVLGQSFFYHRVKVQPQCSSEYSSPT